MRLTPILMSLAVLCACEEDLITDCSARNEFDQAVYVEVMNAQGDLLEPLCVDKFPASRLDASRASPGRDESYAASRADTIPWTLVTPRQAALACGRAGKFLCSADVLNVSDDSGFFDSLAPAADAEIEDGFSFISELEGSLLLPGHNRLLFITEDRKLVGGLAGDEGIQDGSINPIPFNGFQHPLVGFRCCVDSRFREVFTPLGRDDSFVLDTAPEVPVGDAG